MKLYLDDIRPTPPGWVRATTANEAINYLKTGMVQELSLDHDLGLEDSAGTGYEVLQWIETQMHEHAFTPPGIMIVHSANAPATERMLSAIAAINKKAKPQRPGR